MAVKTEQMYEGKAKKVFRTDESGSRDRIL